MHIQGSLCNFFFFVFKVGPLLDITVIKKLSQQLFFFKIEPIFSLNVQFAYHYTLSLLVVPCYNSPSLFIFVLWYNFNHNVLP